MKFMLISPKNRTTYNFRGDLIKLIQSKGYEVIVTGPNQDDIEGVLELGCKFIEIPMNKTGTSIIGDLKYCKKLINVMKQEKPDITLGYTIKPVVYGAIAAHFAKVKNINSLVTGGGYTFTSKSFKARVIGIIVKLLYKIGFGYADNVIFQNHDDIEEFVSKKLVKKSKCNLVNGSGVNIERFTYTKPPKEVSFFMLSRLLKSKGVCEYLEAARKIKEKYPNVKFSLLGKYETEMQDAISKEYIEKFITDGIVERYEETNDVRPYYQQCSVYVLPSYREGMPRTVLEAMACGRAIITTKTNGCRETVIDGKNGFLVPVANVDLLVEAMEKMVLGPELIVSMGEASLSICLDKFDVNKVNYSMIDIMQII